MEKYDSIIIGAGLSGLAAGIRLAHYGQKVCICEQHSRVGGLNSYYHRQGLLLETGLHAMTNLARQGDPKGLPLLKLLRQLRLTLDQLQPREQHYSLIRFPAATLRFDNCFANFEAAVAEHFPDQIDGFRKLDVFLDSFDEVNLSNQFASTRRQLQRFLTDPLLVDMLLCPLLYYGSAIENDMDFSQFAIMYKSIYRQGFFRPGGGIKAWLDLLTARFTESGGELRLNCGIEQILVQDGRAAGVRTRRGEELLCSRILSSIGLPETQQLSGLPVTAPPGELGFFETMAVFPDRTALGNHDESIIFFSQPPVLSYRRPAEPVDLTSGVICFPDNFELKAGDFIPAPAVRTTVLANPAAWQGEDYRELKQAALKAIQDQTARLTDIPMASAIFTDAFTPRTIQRYTGHCNGAIYGSPEKLRPGNLPIEGLFLCGTDQGFLGITGASLSGISMANRHLLIN